MDVTNGNKTEKFSQMCASQLSECDGLLHKLLLFPCMDLQQAHNMSAHAQPLQTPGKSKVVCLLNDCEQSTINFILCQVHYW